MTLGSYFTSVFLFFSTRSVGSAESLLVMGEEFNRMVENIMEMGYERAQVSPLLT